LCFEGGEARVKTQWLRGWNLVIYTVGKLQKFIKEHVECGTIQLSKSLYAAVFFFIKKKNGKL